jgi:class 3 adenylate cyclase
MKQANSFKNNSHGNLEYLLGEMTRKPEREVEITKLVEENFGQDKAVLVLDMSGFCRTAREHSIIRVLSKIYQMRTLLTPCVEANKGQLIKAEADNLFCLFDTVSDALDACGQIYKSLDKANLELEDHCQINVSIGIGYGFILNIENKDLFGDEVNLASKLGEDIAACGEILLTENAYAQLQKATLQIQEKITKISGFELRYHFVRSPCE